jgi:hypothetical protein
MHRCWLARPRYARILNYRRSPAEAPEVLPRSTQLQSLSHSRLEQLLDLRDEAAYLNLEGLRRLCTDEIRLRYPGVARLHHTREQSSVSASSIQSLRASAHGLHTLLERAENDIRRVSRIRVRLVRRAVGMAVRVGGCPRGRWLRLSRGMDPP